MTVKIDDIAYVRHAVPDLERMSEFLVHFGLQVTKGSDGRIYGIGTGTAPFVYAAEPGEPRLCAIGLRARSVADLVELAANEGVTVETSRAPGGGKLLSLFDPDGHRIEVVAGQEFKPDSTVAASRPCNDSLVKRRVSEALRLQGGSSHVQRIGHCVLAISDFDRSFDWYRKRFGMIASDTFSIDGETTIGAFLRCDRGDLPADHHTLALIPSDPARGTLHTAFEVADFDDLMLGHTYLSNLGLYEHVRGIGRHILGSQVFDYWNDPWGNEFEHWTDGDLFTASDAKDCPRSMMDLIGTQWGKPIMAG